MNIKINSPQSVVIDDIDWGAVCDCIANNPTLASDIQYALVDYVNGLTTSLNESKQLVKSLEEHQTESAQKLQTSIESNDPVEIQLAIEFIKLNVKEKEKEKALNEIQRLEEELLKRKQDLGLTT